MSRTEHARPIFLMSPPRTDWTLRGKANFRSRQAGGVDAELARREWALLADAIVAAGGEVVVLPPDPEHNLTGLIYTAEAGELYRRPSGELRFILPTMAAAHRRDEAGWVDRFVRERLGIATESIEERWEAQGDAIRAGSADRIVHTFGVGPDQRTEQAAYAKVCDRLGGDHLQLRFSADPWFHGNTFLNVYRNPTTSDELVVVCPEALDAADYERLRAFLPDARFHEISREQSLGYDTNALQVGQTVLGPTTLSPPTRQALVDLGLTVDLIALDQLFSRGGGAPVCLTNRLWPLRDDEVPDDVRWSTQPTIAAHEL